MAFEGHAHPIAEPSSLEALLGPVEDRYFGAGYRTVRYELRPGAERTAEVVYPPGWSVDGDGNSRPAHLSSVDAAVLTMLAVEQDAAGAADALIDRTRVASIALRAGARPWDALDAVPIRYEVEGTPERPVVRARIGNIRVDVTLVVEPDPAPRVHAPTRDAHAPTVHGGLFRATRTRSTVTDLDLTAGTLCGRHESRNDGPTVAGRGLDATAWPTLTVIDHIVTMGQLTQALVYASAGTTRGDAGQLWMRTMHVDVERARTALPAAFDTTTRIVRDTVLARGGRRVHDVAVESASTAGVRARSTLAYEGGTT